MAIDDLIPARRIWVRPDLNRDLLAFLADELLEFLEGAVRVVR